MFKMLKLILFCTLFINLTFAYISYEGHKVYKIYLDTEEKKTAYQEIENELTYMIDIFGSSIIQKSLDVKVDPENEEKFLSLLATKNINYETRINDLGEIIKETRSSANADLRATENFNWTSYHTYETINNWIDSLETSYPDVVTVFTVGYSYLGNEIKGVKVVLNSSATRVAVIDGGIHAREWITPATTTYILNTFLTTSNESVLAIANSMIWYFIPLLNPDGYNRTFNEDRLHRKNLQPNETDCSGYSGGNGIGVDLNRNFGYQWLTAGGASSNPCAASFAGPYPFSAPETQAFKAFMESISDNLVMYLSMHSYSQILLLPYGHTTDPLDDYYIEYTIGRMAADAIKKNNGTEYAVGNTAEAIYVATGISTDWVKYTLSPKISICAELRDTGTYGFLLPPDQIIDTSEEMLRGVVVMVEQLFRLDSWGSTSASMSLSSFQNISLILFNILIFMFNK